jgi:hypothetical protein
METTEVKRRYEWITTSRIGKVETYLADDEKSIYFESGRFVPKEQFDYQLKPIEEEIFLIKNKGSENPINILPIPTEDQFTQWESILGNEPTIIQSSNPFPSPVVEVNPIRIILEKQKKKEKIKVSLELEIELPNKKVLDLLDVMFDREEVIDEMIKSSTESIDIQTVTENFREQIKYVIHNIFGENESE